MYLSKIFSTPDQRRIYEFVTDYMFKLYLVSAY